MEDYNIFDSGDLELCFGSSEMALQDIEQRMATILRDGEASPSCWGANTW